MTQSVKVLAVKPDELSSVSGISVVEGENHSQKLSFDSTYVPGHVCTHTP